MKKFFKRFKGMKILSLLLLLIMLGSTVTGFMLQAFSWGRRDSGQPEVELPNSNIIDYELTNEQKDYLLREGNTLMKYRYQLLCQQCDAQRSSLEAMTNEFSDQIYLQEIIDEAAAQPTLEIASQYGRRLITDPSDEDILDALCSIMVRPPIRCVVRE